MKTTGRFLLGFVAGALAGATIGILMAPDRGDKTRQIIAETIDEYTKRGKEFIESKKREKEEE